MVMECFEVWSGTEFLGSVRVGTSESGCAEILIPLFRNPEFRNSCSA